MTGGPAGAATDQHRYRDDDDFFDHSGVEAVDDRAWDGPGVAQCAVGERVGVGCWVLGAGLPAPSWRG